jgi:uncharacterized OB-fold protein
MDAPKKPVPQVNPVAQPFWDAAREGRLVFQKCDDCGEYIFYPRQLCPHCHSQELGWAKVSGRGSVYSYTVVKSNSPSYFLADIPYVVAIIQLDEGVRMLSNVVGCDPDSVRCDMPVEVVFEKLDDEFTLPKFKPVGSEG